MNHPSSIDLEAYACEPSGHDPRGAHAQVAAHLAVCAECCAHVERLTAFGQGEQPSAADADAQIARALARIASGTERSAPSVPSAPAERVERPAADAREDRQSTQVRTLRPLRHLYGVVAPLVAAAAIVFFFVRTRPDVQPVPASSHAPASGVPVPDRIQMGEVPSAPRTAAGAGEPDITFKGGIQLAVVRERRGEQARFPDGPALRVRPGDRLRVEVALDREQSILGGVLADDGEYLELMPLAVRGPGLHLSERSAKIDGAPSSGTIVVGSAEAIARVRATRQVAGVTGVAALRVEWEAP